MTVLLSSRLEQAELEASFALAVRLSRRELPRSTLPMKWRVRSKPDHLGSGPGDVTLYKLPLWFSAGIVNLGLPQLATIQWLLSPGSGLSLVMELQVFPRSPFGIDRRVSHVRRASGSLFGSCTPCEFKFCKSGLSFPPLSLSLSLWLFSSLLFSSLRCLLIFVFIFLLLIQVFSFSYSPFFSFSLPLSLCISLSLFLSLSLSAPSLPLLTPSPRSPLKLWSAALYFCI